MCCLIGRHIQEKKYPLPCCTLTFIQVPLRDTISVAPGRIVCLSALHSLRFYDGPEIDLLQTDIMQRLRLLMSWKCSPTTVQDTAPTRYPPVNATIGDLTIIRMVHNEITVLGMLRFSWGLVLIPLSDNTIELDTIEIAATETGV